MVCREEVRAPVSIFALMIGMPRSGSEHHSFQPTIVIDALIVFLAGILKRGCLLLVYFLQKFFRDDDQ